LSTNQAGLGLAVDVVRRDAHGVRDLPRLEIAQLSHRDVDADVAARSRVPRSRRADLFDGG
jgi:hypothetical protein